MCGPNPSPTPSARRPRSQDFVAAALSAFLARSGVAATAFLRLPAVDDSDLVAEQMTLRQRRPLTPQEAGRGGQEGGDAFQLDLCPDGSSEGACF